MASFSKIKCQRLYVGSSSGYATEITSTQTDLLSGITAGTVTASKVVTADSSKNVSGFNDITCGAIDTASAEALYIGKATATSTIIGATDSVVTVVDTLNVGSSGNAGFLQLYPGTASKGFVKFQSADHASNTIYPTINFMAIDTAARTINFPDPGAAAYVAYFAAEADKGLISATPTEVNKYCDESAHAVVSATAETLAVSQATHANKTVVLNRAAGVVATLPEATGTGDVYTFIVGTALTSNAYKVVTADTTNGDIAGVAFGLDQDDDTTTTFSSLQADGNDYIQFAMTTTGGVQPGYDRIELTDIATDLWSAKVWFSVPTGSNPATPFGST